MVLSARGIRAALMTQQLKITPFDDGDIQPASVDIHLGDRCKLANINSASLYSDTDKPEYTEIQFSEKDPLYVHPNHLILVATLEKIRLPLNLSAQVNGVSSLGRLGLSVQLGSPWIDPGYDGHLTLPLVTFSPVPVKVIPRMRVAQLVFFPVDPPALEGYKGRYQFSEGADGPLDPIRPKSSEEMTHEMQLAEAEQYNEDAVYRRGFFPNERSF